MSYPNDKFLQMLLLLVLRHSLIYCVLHSCPVLSCAVAKASIDNKVIEGDFN